MKNYKNKQLMECVGPKEKLLMVISHLIVTNIIVKCILLFKIQMLHLKKFVIE